MSGSPSPLPAYSCGSSCCGNTVVTPFVPGGRNDDAASLQLFAALDDADSPMPTLKLSQMREVELIARLSASGDATRQDDDVESKPVRIALPAKHAVELVIGAR